MVVMVNINTRAIKNFSTNDEWKKEEHTNRFNNVLDPHFDKRVEGCGLAQGY
jgi:hypothetical protein